MAYEAVTDSIRVRVEPHYVAEQSDPEQNLFFWAYTIEIANLGAETVRLRSRVWHITDGHGQRQEVRGQGVVGEEPVLAPGEAFEYTSGCPLPTPSGFMVGSYTMEGASGRRFSVAIPAFSLDSPSARRTLN